MSELARPRALIIDYTPEISTLVRTILERVNGIHEVDSAARGDIAADLLDTSDYDVVVLEAVVPYGQERLLAYLARNRPSVCRRTIVITAEPVAPPVRKEIERSHVYAVFDKPFDLAALAGAVQSCLRTPACAV